MPAVSLQDKGEGSIAEWQHGLALHNGSVVSEGAIVDDPYEAVLAEVEPEPLMSLALWFQSLYTQGPLLIAVSPIGN